MWQLQILLWQHFCYYKQHKAGLFFVVALPFLVFLIIVGVPVWVFTPMQNKGMGSLRFRNRSCEETATASLGSGPLATLLESLPRGSKAECRPIIPVMDEWSMGSSMDGVVSLGSPCSPLLENRTRARQLLDAHDRPLVRSCDLDWLKDAQQVYNKMEGGPSEPQVEQEPRAKRQAPGPGPPSRPSGVPPGGDRYHPGEDSDAFIPAQLLNAVRSGQILYWTEGPCPLAAGLMGRLERRVREFRDFFAANLTGLNRDSGFIGAVARAQSESRRLTLTSENGHLVHIGSFLENAAPRVPFAVRSFDSRTKLEDELKRLRGNQKDMSNLATEWEEPGADKTDVSRRIDALSPEQRVSMNQLWGVVGFKAATKAPLRLDYRLMLSSLDEISPLSHWLQQLLDEAALEVAGVSPAASAFRPIPSGCRALAIGGDKKSPYTGGLVGLCFLATVAFLLAPFLACQHFLQQVLTEKELKLREYLYMMGVGKLRLKLSWLLFYSFFILPGCIFDVLGLKFILGSGLMGNTSALLLLIPAILFGVASLAQCLVFAAVFRTPKGAKILFPAIASFALLISMLLYINLDIYGATRIHAILLSIVSPVVPMSLAVYYAMHWEEVVVGAGWWNAFLSPNRLDKFGGLGAVSAFLAGDILLYLFLAWYLEHVFPGEFGLKQPPWFPFLPSFWCPTTDIPEVDLEAGEEEKEKSSSGTSGLSVGVDLNGLSKKYANKRYGIRNLRLKFYQNQVTAFLGENGAGKSTTMNILVGLTSASSGKASVLGMDVHNNIDEVRKVTGFVPQYDILYPDMVVQDHIKFFGLLRGWSWEETSTWALPIIESLGMTHLLKVPTTSLSGGQKRKLSVLTAFMGSPKVVILDEPTSGVDPFSRRAIWEMLQERRTETTIILSTHFMDEADMLGDRVVIINTGSVAATGTPLDLKSRFGHGFRLILALDPRKPDLDKEAVKAFILGNAAESSLLSEMGKDMVFSLPQEFSRSEKMIGFLQLLEAKQAALGISSFGLTEPTLEEVFFAVVEKAEEEKEEEEEAPEVPAVTSDQIHTDNHFDCGAQLGALFKKKLMFTVKSHWTWTLMILAPILLTAVSILLGQTIHDQLMEGPPIQLSVGASSRRSLVFFRGPETAPFLTAFLEGGLPSLCPGPDCGSAPKPASPDLSYPADLDHSKSSFTCPDKRPAFDAVTERTGPPTQQEAILKKGVEVAGSGMAFNVSEKGEPEKLVDWMHQAASGRDVLVGGVEALRGLSKDSLNKVLLRGLPPSLSPWASGAVDSAVDGPSFLVWYQRLQPDHRMAMANLFTNLRLRSATGTTDAAIRASVQLSSKVSFDSSNLIEILGAVMVNLLVCLAISMGTLGVLFLAMEESQGMKRMQMMYGCKPVLYWLVSFVVDFGLFCLTLAVVVITLSVVDNPTRDHLGVIPLIGIPYAIYAICAIYMLSQLFGGRTVVTALFVVQTVLGLFAGLICGLLEAMQVLCMSQSVKTGKCHLAPVAYVNYVLRLLPSFFLTEGITDLVLIEGFTDMIPSIKFPKSTSFDIYGKRALEAGILSLLFFGLVVLLEIYDLHCSCACCKGSPGMTANPIQTTDPDVLAEEARVLENDNLQAEEPLVIRVLGKQYSGALRPAVAGTSIGVPGGQCFGLLGINGAGKTTTFQMLTGSLKPTTGSAFVNGTDLFATRGWARLKGTSYCPQQNTLFSAISVSQHLSLFMALRGVPSADRDQLEESLIYEVGLEAHVSKAAGQLSGGNQRKLQLAIALIGYPAVIFLDEPTSGMDPGARRRTWACIRRAVALGSAVVLTSHSMDECENLCDRLVIMVAGSFQCLGSVQYLKGHYGNEYSFKVKLTKGADSNDIAARVTAAFPAARLAESHSRTLHFEIASAGLSLSTLFAFLRGLRATCPVEDFSATQTTLEHVFLRLAMVQERLQCGIAQETTQAKAPSAAAPAEAAAEGGTKDDDTMEGTTDDTKNTKETQEDEAKAPVAAGDKKASENSESDHPEE